VQYYGSAFKCSPQDPDPHWKYGPGFPKQTDQFANKTDPQTFKHVFATNKVQSLDPIISFREGRNAKIKASVVCDGKSDQDSDRHGSNSIVAIQIGIDLDRIRIEDADKCW
jgi:hypothetical protein